MVANTLSDTPAVAAGLVNLLFHPVKSVEGLITAGNHLLQAGTSAIDTGISTGDWSQLGNDVDKAEITIGNHPLQAVLGLDGAFEGVKGAAQASMDAYNSATDPNTNFLQDTKTGQAINAKVTGAANIARDITTAATDPNIKFADTPTGQSLQAVTDKVGAVRDNIAKLFANKTTLTEHTADLANMVQDATAKNASYQGAKSTFDSIQQNVRDLQDEQAQLKQELQSKQGADAAETQAKLDENQAKRDQLEQQAINARKAVDVAKDAADESFVKRIAEVNKETSNQRSEMSLKNGFDSDEKQVGAKVSDFFKKAKSRVSGIYDMTLGNAKVNVDPIVQGLRDYADRVRGENQFKTATGAELAADQLKLRDLVNSDEFNSSPGISNDQMEGLKQLYGENYSNLGAQQIKMLEDSGVDKKLWDGKSIEDLKSEFKPFTSENLKGTRNKIYSVVSGAAQEGSSLAHYMKTVAPAFDKSFGEAVRSVYGTDRLNVIKANDADWAELKNNPLSKDENPPLNKIKANWDSFSSAASKVQGGGELVSKIQNFVGQRILDNAESLANPGEFDAKKILSGLDKYSEVLKDGSDTGRTIAERLQRVADDNRAIDEERAQKAKDLQNAKQQIGMNKAQAKLDLSQEKKAIVSEGNEKASDTAERLKQVNAQAKATEANAKAIGADKPDFVDNVTKINSPEKLESFVSKTGKTAEEVGGVIIHSALKPVMDSIENLNFDPEELGRALKQLDKVGGGDPDVRAKMLGASESDIENLKAKYEEYQNAAKSEGKGKTFVGRVGNLALGGLMVALLPFGKFFGIRKIFSAITPDASTVADFGNAAKSVSDLAGTTSPIVKETLPFAAAGNIPTNKKKD